MNPDAMVAVVHTYVEAFGQARLDRIVSLFARDASVEDPVGTEPIRGIEAIKAFYQTAMSNSTTLKLEGPIRVASDYAAFPFRVSADADGRKVAVDVIDTFRFNEDHKIVEMRAYFGPLNFQQG